MSLCSRAPPPPAGNGSTHSTRSTTDSRPFARRPRSARQPSLSPGSSGSIPDRSRDNSLRESSPAGRRSLDRLPVLRRRCGKSRNRSIPRSADIFSSPIPLSTIPTARPLGTIHVLKDFTERRQAENKFRILFEKVQEGVFISTPDGPLPGFQRCVDAHSRLRRSRRSCLMRRYPFRRSTCDAEPTATV